MKLSNVFLKIYYDEYVSILWYFLSSQDYEYASYNPVAYDLANHFCEMAANYHSDTPHILDYSLYPGQ